MKFGMEWNVFGSALCLGRMEKNKEDVFVRPGMKIFMKCHATLKIQMNQDNTNISE